jgi:Family of unknown function (DUF5317)
VTIVALALLAAIAVNLVRGTDPFAFVSRSWKWPAVPFVCAMSQLVNGLVALPLHGAVTVTTQVAVVGWLAMQFRHQRDESGDARRGVGALFAGALLNTIPIIRYGAMPVSARALVTIGTNAGRDVSRGQLGKHVLMQNYGVVGWLGDILPLPYPIVRSVISFGDIAMAFGIVFLVVNRRGASHSQHRSVGGSVY